MRALDPNKAPELSPKEFMTEVKLKLKNANVSSLATYVDRKEKSLSRKIKTLLGKKVETPLGILALAELHAEATYKQNGQHITPAVPTCTYAAAKAYLVLKDMEVNPHPGQPLPRRSTSTTSKASSTATVKSVTWAERLETVRLFSND